MIAAELGSDAATIERSAEEYQSSVQHERTSASLPETHLETLIGA
jgi:hypothetical protein